jgi:2-iminobutanoate/2-iminopropanoate deaminase
MATPVGPYTPIVRAGDWLIVSGQVGIVDGKLVDGGTEGQLEQALANMEALLQAKRAPPRSTW